MIGLKITDGTTTIDLNDGNPWEVMELDLGYGDPSERETAGSIRLLHAGLGGGRGALQTMAWNFQALQRLLQQGIDYWSYDQGAEIMDSGGNIVYLEWRFDATNDVYYRSPITKARYSLPNETTWAINVEIDEVEYVIDFMRKNWWEGPEEQLPLTTHIETVATTSAVEIYNPKPYIYDWVDGLGGPSVSFDETGGEYFINDAQSRLGRFVQSTIFVRGTTSNDGLYTINTEGAAQLKLIQAVTDEAAAADTYILAHDVCNYVEIDLRVAGGDLPSPVRLEYTDWGAQYGGGSASDAYLYEMWIGHWFNEPDDEEGIVLEAEEGNYDYVDDLMDTDNPPGSGGYYIQYTEPFPGAMVTYGTAIGGTVGEIYMSASHTEVDGTFDGMAIYIADGTNKGLWRTIVHYNRGSPNSCTITPALPTPCTTSSKYQIYPAGTTAVQPLELVPISWTLTSNWTTDHYRARYFKAILKLYDTSGSPDDYNYQLRIRREVGSPVIWEGPIVRYGGFDTDLQARDLGTFRIPPAMKTTGTQSSVLLELVLTPYDGTVTDVTGINIDYLMLLPVDGFRYLKFIGGLRYGETVFDSGYDDFSYYSDAGSSIYNDIIARGNQIMLQPRITQRIYFFLGEDIFRRGTVSLYYRPRRLNL